MDVNHVHDQIWPKVINRLINAVSCCTDLSLVFKVYVSKIIGELLILIFTAKAKLSLNSFHSSLWGVITTNNSCIWKNNSTRLKWLGNQLLSVLHLLLGTHHPILLRSSFDFSCFICCIMNWWVDEVCPAAFKSCLKDLLINTSSCWS